MTGFTDIHAHFVYGVDDGAKTVQMMEDMLDAAQADGIAALFATPHITPGIEPFPFELFEQRLEEARVYCRRRGYEVQLYGGAEVMYTPALLQTIVERRLPTLGESDHVLLEFVPDISYREIETAVEQMERSGYMAVLAHVERYNCFFLGKNAWKLKREHEVLYQINAGSVIEGRGFLRDAFIRRWLREGLIDFVASDAHNCTSRPFRLREAYGALARQYSRKYAGRLVGME